MKKSEIKKINTKPFVMFGAVVLALMSVHFIRVEKILPLEILFDKQPLVTNNYGQLYARAMREEAFEKQSGRSSGYDPFHMAGYPSASLVERDSMWSVRMVRWLAPLFGFELAVKILAFGLFLIFPIMILSAAILFEASPPAALLSLAMAVAGFGGHDIFSQRQISLGGLDLLFGSYLSILVSGLFYRSLKSENSWYFSLYCAGLLALSYINPIFLALTIAPLIVLFVVNLRELQFSFRLRFILSIVVSIGFSAFLSQGFGKLAEFSLPNSISTASLSDFSNAYIPVFRNGSIPFFQALFRLLVLMGACLGIGRFLKEKKQMGYGWMAWMVLTVIFIVAGSRLPGLASYHPRQFLFYFSLLQIIPGAIFIQSALTSDYPGVTPIFAGVLLYLGTQGLFGQKMSQPLQSLSLEKQGTIISDLKKLPKEGRVLIETDYFSYRLEEAYPFLTGHAFLGGPGPFTRLVQYRETSFVRNPQSGDFNFFGAPWALYDEEAMRGALQAYNVRYVLAKSLSARSKFDRYPASFKALPSPYAIMKSSSGWPLGLEVFSKAYPTTSRSPLARIPYRIYEVMGTKPGYLLKGSGEVEADYDKIVINHPSKGDLLLKFYWFPGLKAPENVTLQPRFVAGNNKPFIMVTNDSTLDSIILSLPR